MARWGALAALALLMSLPGLSARATVIACPGSDIIHGDATGAGATKSDAVRDSESKADSAKASMAADLSCKVETPPCSLHIAVIDKRLVITSQGKASWRAKQGWSWLAACHGGPAVAPLRSRTGLPPPGPTSRTAGAGGAGAGASSGVAPPSGPTPPANCNCPQLSTDEVALADAEAAERALIGKIKSAQVLGEPTGALEAQLAGNASLQARLRAQIKFDQQRCPQSCQQPQSNLPPQQSPNPWPPGPSPK
jgi:hypothetical protein